MSDIDGEPMEDSDLEEALDGEPLEEDSAMETEQKEEAPSKSEAPSQLESGPPARKPRPRAEDMFADSDTE